MDDRVTGDRFCDVRTRTEALAAPLSRRGPDGPVDARREPDEVAPGPHDVVLRDVRARRHGPRPRPTTRRSTSSSTRTTSSSARGSSEPAAGCSRGRAPPRSAGTARPSTRACASSSPTGLDERHDELVVLGLHHEQQHQELLLMDIKHVLSQHPQPRRLRRAGGPACRRAPARSGRTRDDRPRRRRRRGRVPTARPSASTTSSLATASLVVPARARRATRQLRGVPRVHRRRRLRASRAVAVGGLGDGVRAAAGVAPLYWRARRRGAGGASRCTAPRTSRATIR